MNKPKNEGFARKSVANWIHADEDDYLTILETLGSECLGAIRIYADEITEARYDRLSIREVKTLAKEGVSKSTEIVTEAHLYYRSFSCVRLHGGIKSDNYPNWCQRNGKDRTAGLKWRNRMTALLE